MKIIILIFIINPEEFNNIQINDEINIDSNNNNIEKEKINDDSIETIPINDEKTMTNISFRDDFKELLNKNDDFLKLRVNGTLKVEENHFFNQNNNTNNFTRTLKAIKTYNKKNFINNSSSKVEQVYNNQLTNPNNEEKEKNEVKLINQNYKYKKVYDKTLSKRKNYRK